MESGKQYKLLKSIYSTPAQGMQILWLEGSIFKLTSVKENTAYLGMDKEKLVMLSIDVSLFTEYFSELK